MNYIGSKRKLANSIKAEISQICPEGIFCDLFAGTGAVSEKFGEYSLIVNDWEDYSYAVNYQKFGEKVPDNLEEKVKYLNGIEPFFGFITEHYSGERTYFTEENAMKIDGIRVGIEEVSQNKEEETYLVALLLHAADAVANTASVYGAFLKNFKATALKSLILVDTPKYSYSGKVYSQDANTLDISGDILYLDPPYNNRHYGSNYHILNTITNYEEFVPKGKTGLPEYKKSDYCSKVKIKDAFQNLIDTAKFEHIFISYNNEGILNFEDFKAIGQEYSMTQLILDANYQRFKSNSLKQKRDNTTEYLYYLVK